VREQSSFSRRRFLVLAGMGAAGAALAACGATPVPQVVKETVVVQQTVIVKETVAPSLPVAEVVEITYLDLDETGAGDVAYKVYAEQVIAPFEAQNPNIKVNFQAGEGDWPAALLASMAAGNAPDVFVHFIGNGRKMMEAGQMLPLQEHIQEDDLADFLDEQLLAMRIGPSLFAMPKYASCIAMAYNKDLLDKAGVEYPTDEWTWDDFLQALSHTADLGTSELGPTYGYFVNYEYIEQWVWQNGGEWMNKPILGTKILIDEEKALQALKVNYDMVYKDHWAPTRAEVEGLGWTTVFQTGRVAFNEVHSWMVSECINNNEFNFDFVMLPKGPAKRAGQVFNDAWSVWSKSKAPDEAVTFLKYITSAENEKTMMLSIHGWLPSRKSLFDAWANESLGAQKGYNVASYTNLLPDARQQPYFLTDAKVREIKDPLWQRIWETGDLPLEEGVKEVCTRVNEYLATVA
jgi:multiple sugar transport system substrate-binding protein